MPFDAMPISKPIRAMNEDQQLLWNGAQVIRRYGLAQRDLGSISRGYCVYGALTVAKTGNTNLYRIDIANDLNLVTPAAMLLEQFLAAGHICDWNNEVGRTKDEVIAAMEGAARAG